MVTWERVIDLPRVPVTLESLSRLLIDELNNDEVEEFVEGLICKQRPIRQGFDPFDTEW